MVGNMSTFYGLGQRENSAVRYNIQGLPHLIRYI